MLRKNGLEAQEGEITQRHFRGIKGELTDLKDFIRGYHWAGDIQNIESISTVLLTSFSMLFLFWKLTNFHYFLTRFRAQRQCSASSPIYWSDLDPMSQLLTNIFVQFLPIYHAIIGYIFADICAKFCLLLYGLLVGCAHNNWQGTFQIFTLSSASVVPVTHYFYYQWNSTQYHALLCNAIPLHWPHPHSQNSNFHTLVTMGQNKQHHCIVQISWIYTSVCLMRDWRTFGY